MTRPSHRRGAPYLRGCRLLAERIPEDAGYPFDLPCVADLSLTFDSAVTFLVGENGSGKSTVLEGLAELCGLPVGGGGAHDLADVQGYRSSGLADTLRPHWATKPRDTFFFRAETLYNFGALLDRRREDPDFWGDPYRSYGGASLQEQSHGEGFLSVMANRLGSGLYLFDEPESALSPDRQLSFLALLDDRVRHEGAQFIIATHSPLLLTYPEATILSFDEGPPHAVGLQDTEHFRITTMVLNHPEAFWRSLRRDEG